MTRPTPLDGGDHSGGGPQGERIEGSLTDGGSMAGETDDDRAFGAGRKPDPGETPDPSAVDGKDGPPVA